MDTDTDKDMENGMDKDKNTETDMDTDMNTGGHRLGIGIPCKIFILWRIVPIAPYGLPETHHGASTNGAIKL